MAGMIYAARYLPGLVLLLILSVLPGCGGGGGGGDDGEEELNAADVSISVSPDSIDAGDRVRVRTSVSNVNADGVLLKFRYPAGLAFVAGSASVAVEGRESAVAPQFQATTTESQSLRASATPTPTPASVRYTYLVFILGRDLFTRPGEPYSGEAGTVSFLLEGVGLVEDAAIGVDPDLNDPAIPDYAKFDADTPMFEPESEVGVSVQN